jgi:hypothetical protein
MDAAPVRLWPTPEDDFAHTSYAACGPRSMSAGGSRYIANSASERNEHQAASWKSQIARREYSYIQSMGHLEI